MANYLLIFSNNKNYRLEQVHDLIIKSPGVTDWWHYLPTAYILTSDKALSDISDYVISKIPGMTFLITEFNTEANGGLLKKNAWEWIKKKNNKPLTLKEVKQVKSFNDIFNQHRIKPETEYSSFFTALDEQIKKLK